MDSNTQPKLTKKQNSWMVIKFILFSASAGIIQAGSFALIDNFAHLDALTNLDELFGNDYGLTYFISLIISVLWNFTFNRKFTFKSAVNMPIAMLKVFAFYLVFTPLSIWWGVALTGIGWNKYIVLALTMLVNLSTEFIYDRYLVYGKTVYSNEDGQRELREKSGETE